MISTERDKLSDELQEIESQSLEDVQVELDKEMLYRQFGRDKVLYEIGKKITEAYKPGYQDAVELYCLVDDDDDLTPTPPVGDQL